MLLQPACKVHVLLLVICCVKLNTQSASAGAWCSRKAAGMQAGSDEDTGTNIHPVEAWHSTVLLLVADNWV